MSTIVYEDDASKPSARLAAVCACLLMFVALVDSQVVGAITPQIAAGLNSAQMSGVAVAYFLAPVVGVPLGAWLAGSVGWRAVFAASAALVAVAGLLVRRFPLSTSSETESD